ncbi:MAG: outer membrane protein [Betaproteobacteria bacterium]|nr:MAG: outer membrane protein [Betaproteobacteria bacterium]
MRALNRTCGLLVIAALALAAAPAHAQDNGAFAFGGWRAGGGFEDSATREQLRLGDRGAASLAIDFGIDGARQLELFVSRQRTQLETLATGAQPFPLTVTYLHVGGTNFFEGPIGRGPYVVGGLGTTIFAPGLDGFRSETRPSLAVGVGYLLPLTGPLALRVELRGYATLVNSSGGLFCSGGCVLTIRGDSLTQGEVLIGVGARF